jgi:hypothetical protein
LSKRLDQAVLLKRMPVGKEAAPWSWLWKLERKLCRLAAPVAPEAEDVPPKALVRLAKSVWRLAKAGFVEELAVLEEPSWLMRLARSEERLAEDM